MSVNEIHKIENRPLVKPLQRRLVEGLHPIMIIKLAPFPIVDIGPTQKSRHIDLILMYRLQDFVQHRLIEDRLGYFNPFLLNSHVICIEYRESDFGDHDAVFGRVDGVKILENRAHVLVKDLA